MAEGEENQRGEELSQVEQDIRNGVDRVVAEARANGTARPASPVTVRHVDPATLQRDPALPPPTGKKPHSFHLRTVKRQREPEARDCAREGCPERFSTTDSRRRYCSQRCQDTAKRHRKGTPPMSRPIECAREDCDVTFVRSSPRQRYCSTDCRDNAQREISHTTKNETRDAARLQRAGERAAGGTPPPASTNGGGKITERAPALQERYVELLFKLLEGEEDAAVKIEAMGRLEKIVSAPPPR